MAHSQYSLHGLHSGGHISIYTSSFRSPVVHLLYSAWIWLVKYNRLLRFDAVDFGYSADPYISVRVSKFYQVSDPLVRYEKSTRHFWPCGLSFLVEISGIEPLTSWMPFKRSPSWAIPPCVGKPCVCAGFRLFQFSLCFCFVVLHIVCASSWANSP